MRPLPEPTEDVIAAARRYFSRARERELESCLDGPLLAYFRLFDGLPGVVDPLVNNAEIRHLRVASIEARAALCDCDVVTARAFVNRSGRSSRAVDRITGPLVLQRDDEAWKVVDYVLNGRRVLRSLRLYDGTEGVVCGGGLSVRPRAVLLGASWTVAVIELSNGSADEVSIDQATIRGKGRIGPWLPNREYAFFAGQRRVSPGSTGRIVLSWSVAQVLLVKSVEVATRFAAAETGTLVTIPVSFPFRAHPEPTVPAYDLV